MRRYSQACLVFFVSVLSLAGIYDCFQTVQAQDGSSWFASDAPTLSETVGLPPNIPPNSSNLDCDVRAYVPAGQLTGRGICTQLTVLGRLSIDSKLETGPVSYTDVTGFSRQSFLIPTYDTAILVSLPATTLGNNIGIYRGLTKANLQLNVAENQGAYYSLNTLPEAMLKNQTTGQLLQVNTADVAISHNGRWMVANMPRQGLIRVDLTDLSVQQFTGPIEPDWYLSLAAPSMAISNDGRYVAANVDIFSSTNLTVYDLSTCSDQMNVPLADRKYCAGRNIWQGQNLQQLPMGQGILAVRPDLAHPTRLRFINDDNISFDARYDVDGNTYKAGTFVATAPGVVQHKIGLLGMGDSYISGQGAFMYRGGTDTANNGCHLSELSYPFILGKQNFNSYNSIACSGAVTRNISSNLDSMQHLTNYRGQVRDGIQEASRDKPTILANFLPGYLYQEEFAETYQPEAILLSVGGDDIGFADIVKKCVANAGGGTCYDTYAERMRLVYGINGIYPILVHTYATLRQQSGWARIYAVGYPQVAKPGGGCGLNVHLNANEVQFTAQLISYLDDVIKQAAQTAGVFYVDTQQAFDGHRLCEAPADQSAMNGFTVGNDAGVTLKGHAINFIGAESYHPTQLGYQLLAQTIAQKTANLTAAMPSPTEYQPPPLDPATPLLQAFSPTGELISPVYYDNTMSGNVLVRGESNPLTLNDTQLPLRPGSVYRVVVHSDPVTVGTGTVNADGTIGGLMNLPANITPGYHTLHVYTTDMSGTQMDIQKIIYVAASADDYNGDGVSNAGDPCIFFPVSGIDADKDGVDDVCDQDIQMPLQATFNSVTTDSQTVKSVGGSGSNTKLAAAISEQPSASQNSGKVLGYSTDFKSSTQPTMPRSVTTQTATGTQLFRVDWLTVFFVGLGASVAISSVYAYLAKR